MKRYGDLWERIVTFESLERAFHVAALGRRFRPEVLEFKQDLEGRLLALQADLQSGRYRTGTYRVFKVYEPKERDIFALPLRDRVVHHALIAVIGPLLERTFLFDSYACRKGKGTHRALDRLTQFLRQAHRQWPEVYALKGDIAKCFPSLDHHVLMGLLRRKIKCPRTLGLLEEIVFSTGSMWDPDSRHLPIGNLTSQWLCNFYLTELDAFVKYRLRAPYYLRYMDDWVVLAPDKAQLGAQKDAIEAFASGELRLALNPKTAIFPARLGVDFLGFRVFKTHRRLRRAAKRRIMRSVRGLDARWRAGRVDPGRASASLASWRAHLAHGDTVTLSWRLLADLEREVVNEREAHAQA